MQGGKLVSQLASIPAGAQGVQATMRNMRANVLASASNPLIGQLARTIVASVTANDESGEAAAIQKWVQRNIRYTRDPSTNELVQAPEVTLRVKQGDCDDQAQLTAALLMSVGHACRLVAVGFQPGAYSHVYTESRIAGEWLTVETIRPWSLGQAPVGVVVRQIVGLTGNNSMDQVGKINIGKALKSIVKPKNLLKVVKVAAGGAAAYATGGVSAVAAAGTVALNKKAAKITAKNKAAAIQPEPSFFALPAPSSGAPGQSFGDFVESVPTPVKIGVGAVLAWLVIKK